MLRLTPPDYNKIDQSQSFLVNYGGGEANVAVSLSHFGHKTYFVSKLPPNILGDAAIQHLRGHGVNTDYIVRGGSTLGIYFLEPGFGGRPSKVIYNRKHSAMTRIKPEELDFDEIFREATWFHVSGISPALGEKVREVLFLCLKACGQYHIPVSFDFNYRSKLWTVEEAIPHYKNMMPYVDVVFASAYDCETILGIESDEKIQDSREKRANLFERVLREYDIRYLFGTDRTIYTATENSLAGYCVSAKEQICTDPIRFNIYDRIGGGDAFASGVIHGLLQDLYNPKYALQFGLVASVLKHTIYGDASVLKCEDILDYMGSSENRGIER